MDASGIIRRAMSTPISSLSGEEEDSDSDQDVRLATGLYGAFVYARGCRVRHSAFKTCLDLIALTSAPVPAI